MADRFFVTVISPTKAALVALGWYCFGLFPRTTEITANNEFTTKGLLDLEEIGSLVNAGYHVLVEEHVSKRARARTEAVEYEDWLTRVEDWLKQANQPLLLPGYLKEPGIKMSLKYIANRYSSICQLISLDDEKTSERRICCALKIANGSGADRHGMLFISGVHGLELVGPDILVSFALELCQAYMLEKGLAFGNKSYEASTIKMIVDSLDIFIFPLVNPDGRAYAQSPTGDDWWRKNRNPNPGMACMGVDINRNFDFLWSSGIGTSANSCDLVYRGTEAFSEPESRNVMHLLDTFPNISAMIDIHSPAFAPKILYPWGDDENQVDDPKMKFTNSDYDGKRGTAGDTQYKEYILQADWDWCLTAANNIRDAIAAVRGTVYPVMQASLLYQNDAISGDSIDYSFSRSFSDPTKHKVYGLVIEAGAAYQPPYSEAVKIIEEVSAGLVQYCLSCLCIVEETIKGTKLANSWGDLRVFRDHELMCASAGRKYVQQLGRHSVELLQIMNANESLRKQTLNVLQRVYAVIRSRHKTTPKIFEPDLITEIKNLAEVFARHGSSALKETIFELKPDLKYYRGRTVLKGLERASSKKIERSPRQ
jgi:carboxypeptidase T